MADDLKVSTPNTPSTPITSHYRDKLSLTSLDLHMLLSHQCTLSFIHTAMPPADPLHATVIVKRDE